MKSAEVKLLADLTAERAENIPPRELCTVVWAWAALRARPVAPPSARLSPRPAPCCHPEKPLPPPLVRSP